MSKRNVGLLLAAVLAASAACQSEEPDDHDGSGEGQAPRSTLTAELTTIAEQDGLPGFAVAVVNPDGTIDSAAVGEADIDAGEPVTTDTLFHIGSTHKAVTALLVATLVDDGVLDWDDSVADLVEADLDPDITMRHLLTMTSGLPAAAEDALPEAVRRQPSIDDAVFSAFSSAEPLGPPGEVFEYSNVSTAVAGYAAAAAGDPDAVDLHQAYLDQIRERVLDPLQMTDSAMLASQARATGDLARSYEMDGDEPVELASEDTDLDLLAPAGSLKSSADDMARFLAVLLHGGQTPDGTQIVSPEAIATMWAPEIDGYAMGWETGSVDGVDYLSHDGSYDGFLSLLMVVPDRQVALVLLTNSESAGGDLVSSAPALFVETTG
ncbi:MAG TPA: serine hydrolase domain-containing protein [Ornithinimicrobium sp.]|uniref:serine hydrolase domain-containing protein n=1 Tax=Ornithinimicrobium sp. TaxID=1977084 RepID=UPI002B484DE0|nr:serine hydrolase domain-containing protein [Ornithinimicrobium sp.]HKJ11839.1 serine hydrolase domain-containing protein [Ornithinimicrobium sp.]